MIQTSTPQKITDPRLAFIQNLSKKPAEVIPTDRIREAIAHNETGIIRDNPYAFSQPSGKKKLGGALGRYQVTAGELASYAPRYLGQKIAPEEFLASSTAQDNYINNKIRFYAKEGYSPQEIADIHRRGITKSFPAGSGRYQDPGYVAKFNANFYPKLLSRPKPSPVVLNPVI